MTTLHIRHRLRGMRTSYRFRNTVVRYTALFVGVGLVAAALLWIDNTNQHADEQEQKAIKAKYKVSQLEETWISCLENKAVWIGDELHTCSILNTRLSKGDFK